MNTQIFASSINIGKKIAPNRIAVHPMECNDGDSNGAPTERTLDRYCKFAEGGAGLIFVESLSVSPESRSRINQLQATETNVMGLDRMVREIRKVNPHVLIIFQLSHSGGLSDPGFATPVSVYGTDGQETPVLSERQIEEIRSQFVQAAVIARKVGADGIDFKQSHGVLAGEMLRPNNTRPDRYGGAFENRTRFFSETIEEIKSALRDQKFLIGTRCSVYEGIPGGFGTTGPGEATEDFQEPLAFVKMCESKGLDFVSVSAGEMRTNVELISPPKTTPELTFQHFLWAKKIKDAVSIPVIGAGYSSLMDGENDLPGDDPAKKSMVFWAEKNLRDDNVDLVGFGRQALADPWFPAKILQGKDRLIKYCVCCGGCGSLVGAQKHAGCIVYDKYYRDLYSRVNKEKQGGNEA